MSTLKGNLKLLNSNINVQEKKKIWLDTIKDDPICLKGCDYKSLKSIALTFFKDKNLYNEENLVILNFFCKEKLDDFLLNDEIMEFLQKTYLLYEYFIKEGCDKINKKQFIENISECCKRIFLKNIIKHEKEILDFLLKNLMNYINKYSFCLIYQSLYNIYQYNQNNYNQIYYVKQNPTFEFLLCLENKKINNEVLLINNNKFAIDSLFVLNENDEKGIREYFEKNGNVTICDAYRERENIQEDEGYKNYNYESDKNNDIVEYVNDNKKEQRGTILRTKQSTSSNDKNISKNLESLNKEFSCFYLFIYFKSCFENINFYLIEKFIENYYINHNNENIYKELLLFLFLIYKDKMNTLVDRILTDSINYLNNNYTASIINNNDSNNNHNNIYHKSNSSNRSYSKNYSHNHLESHKKQKRNTNENIKERNKELYLSDCLFYYELLINIIIYKNLNYENNYEYYLNFIKTLHDNDTFQEMFLSSFFFVYISTNDVSIRNVLLTNFIKYGSKRFSTLSKLFTSIKRIFYIIYHDIVDEMYIYNNKLFTNIPGQYSIRRNEILDTDEKELNYLNFVKNNNNICIDKYICLFFKEVYYIISRTNMEYFALVTHLYLYTYDYIFQKIINVIYENEMNLNDTSFDICKQVLKPFLFLYVDIFDSFIEALKKNVYSEKVMITYSFIKKYLFKNMYEKSFLQKDLFYVIYHIYFLQYVLKYNFLNFLTNFITTKRNVSQYLKNFLKLKEEHMKEIDATLEKNGNYENQKEILNEKEILDENENLNEKEILDVNENLNEKEVLDEKQNNHDMLEDDKKIKKLNNEKDDKVEKAQRTKRTESKYGGNKKGYYNEDDSSDDDNSDDEEWDDYKHIKSYRNGRNKKQENNNNNNNKKRKKANDKNKNNVEKMDVIDLSCSDKESEEERYRKKKKDSKKDIKSDDNNNKNDDENDNKNNYNNNIQNNNMYNKNNNNSSSFLNNDDPELLCDKMSEEEGQKNKCVNNVVDAEKERIISFFEKNYLVLKYFTSYTDDMIFGHDESYITSLDDYIDIKEHTKLKRISNNMKNMNKSNNNNNNNNENDNQHNNNNNNSSSNYNYIGASSDDKSRFIRKLHSFYNKKRNVDNTINELFLNNKDNVYSKILKNNLSIIKELRNLRMDILYPIFNASLVFLFDDFYFFIIQNIKLVIEEKEKFYYDHKIFLNTSLILLHCLSKDVKIEKYLVSIFYILKLSFNKLKSIEIINEGIHQNKEQIYDKNTKTFQNNVKYYNIKKDKDIVTSYVACHKKNNDDHENNNKNITLNELEENINLYQNVFYIFLKLLQNISKTNNLYYNFKFIIYDILFSPYSNKKIIFSCMKCILDRSKLDEIYNYCLNVLDKIKMDENIIEELLNVEDNISHNNNNNNNNMDSCEYNKYNSDLSQENDINQNNKGFVKKNINYNIQHNNSNNFNNDEHFKHISLKNINETYIKENNYLPLILYNKNNIGNSFFFNDIEKNSKSREISSLYINILILYYIITQKEKTNKKTTYCDNYLKFDIDNCRMIINKLICLLHTNNDFNSSYYKYIKYLSFKTFKKIYSYLSIKEADIYTGHIKNKSTEDIINEDKKLNDIKVLKLEILEYFYIISNKEIKEYIMKNKKSNNTKQNNLSTYSDEYRFFFSNNLNCNNIILKNDNFYFMINSLLFIFNMKYDKATFYKLITIILMEKNEYKNYVLEKIIPSIKKFFKLSYIINNVKRENKKQNLKLSNDIMNHSVLLYIIRTIIILFLLIDYNHINKHNIIINENYISYHMFINDYIKKKSLKYYYTQLNFLLFRIFYNEKNLSYFFKMFFTTLYIISFKKKGNENMMFFFEKIFHLNILDENVYSSTNKKNKLLKNTMNVQENHQIVEDMKKFKEENEEDNNNPNFVDSEEEKQNYNKKNKNSVENSGKNIVGTHKQRKNKSVNKSEKNTKYNKGYNTDDNSTENDTNDNNNTENDTNDNNTENDTNDNNTENNTDSNTEDHSQDSHSLYSSDEEVRKNYREILRSHKKNDGGLNKKCIKYKSTVRSNGSTTSSSNDSDDTFRIRINKKRKNKNSHNKKKKQQKNKKRNSSSLDDNLITYVEQKSQRTNSSNEMKYTQVKKSGKKEYILNQQQMKPFTDNIMEKMEKEMNIENFQFNGSLSVKILNHLIFLCKGFHEDLELKIYNGIKSCLKDNEMDKEKLKHLLEQNIKEDQHIHSHGSSIKYKKKLELLKMIDTKIIFLTYIKDNLEKRKSLVSRMSELNLNIFKNKSMFHIDIDFI